MPLCGRADTASRFTQEMKAPPHFELDFFDPTHKNGLLSDVFRMIAEEYSEKGVPLPADTTEIVHAWRPIRKPWHQVDLVFVEAGSAGRLLK